LAYVEESSLIFLAFVIPLALYCLVLSILNRRRHPVIVSGAWDFAGVLFAASGILLVGGPAILTGLYEQWRLAWLLGQTRYLQGIGENWGFWISLWLLYFAAVACGSALLLWRRRWRTSIYNVEPAVFAELLSQVLDRPELEVVREAPGCFRLRFCEPPVESKSEMLDSIHSPKRTPVASSPSFGPLPGATVEQPASIKPWVELAVEAFPFLRHVTLRWRGSAEALRLDIETELADALAQVRTRPNAIGVWFLSLALGLFSSGLLALFALVVMRILQLPR
jgi:hypothetical protein